MSRKAQFDKHCEWLKLLGSDFNLAQEYRARTDGSPGSEQHDVDSFSSVFLPLTGNEWCHLCMSDGDEYIGGCCGASSAIQDMLNYWFRMGSGWVDTDKFHEMAQRWVDHGDSYWKGLEHWNSESATCQELWQGNKSLKEAVIFAKTHWDDVSPWNKILLIWYLVKDFSAPEVPHGSKAHISEMEQSIHILSRCSSLLAWDYLMGKQEQKSGQEDANKMDTLARMYPALKHLYDSIHDYAPVPFEGFALVDTKAGPQAVARNRLGLCVYETREEVDNLLASWNDNPTKEGDTNERFNVVSIRITLEEGLVFL